jgi:hypothetical protein
LYGEDAAMSETSDFHERLRKMLLNDPAVSAMCEQIQLNERRDMARLNTFDLEAYARLRAKGETHDDAIWWLDRARPLRRLITPKARRR